MKNPVPLLALVTLAAACVNVAEAQPAPHHPAPNHPAPNHPIVLPPPPTNSTRTVAAVVDRVARFTGPTCVGVLGCVPRPPIARCAPGAAPLTFAQAVDQRLRLAGQTVAIRGRLQASHVCTEMACAGRTCCNHCSGELSLHGVADSSLRELTLGVEHDPLFACGGDDSGLCCVTAIPAGDVVARGVLRATPGAGGAFRIESPTLCTPE